MKKVLVAGGFDDLGSAQMRFLEEAAKLGQVHVLLWPDQLLVAHQGMQPKFPAEERRYFLESVRYVHTVSLAPVGMDDLRNCLDAIQPDLCAVCETDDISAHRAFCDTCGLASCIIKQEELQGFPGLESVKGEESFRKRVIVTGCYDWFHSGHVRFFEEVSALGDLHVVVGHDANIRLLKGEGHPLFPAEERRYMVQSIRFVRQALVSTGHGWLDAEPEIGLIKPQIYAVNEDGDKLEKQQFCAAHGIEYVVLHRKPKEGLPRRQSTDLRGF
jgi:cytidyltransferase-like protein